MGVSRGVFEFCVTKQCLDYPYIHTILKKMSSESVPEAMHSERLLDAGIIAGKVNRPVKLSVGHRVDGILSRKQPTAGQHLTLRVGMAVPLTE